MQNILLLGGTGFIGSHIAEAIIKNNHVNLLCLVRYKSDTSFLQYNNIPFEKVDFSDSKKLTSFFDHADIIVNAFSVS